ncbi:MAG: hypothetical protein GC159_18425 [Phycisphaera sp.]|nr:hypothetical protein [Phycisphaera sp.]
MKHDEDNFMTAWHEAARDLEIEVSFSYEVDGDLYPIHVANFGRPLGALPVPVGDARRHDRAQEKGYFCSQLNPDLYCKYDRELFIETLLDWGWRGPPEQAPRWYRSSLG